VSLLLRANNDGATVGKTYLAINPYDSSSDTYMGTMIGAEEYDAADRRAHMTFFTRGSNSHVAPTERMRITSAGRVGIGTATPAYKLDVNGDINLAAGSTLYYDHGNLSANDSIVLHIDAGSDNDVSIFRVSTDSWNTTGDYGVTMKYMGDENGIYNGLSIFMDNQTGTQIEAMSFLQNGKVGINRIDPIYRRDVLGDGSTAYAARFTAGAGTAHGVKIQLGSPSPGTKWLLFDDSTGTEHGCIQGSGNGVSFHNNSDRRLKKDIVDLDNGVAVINALQPRFFVWDGCDDLGQQAGFIADEVQPVLPAIVKGETDAMKVTPAIEGREEEVDADGNVIRQGVEAEPERTVIDPQQLDIGKMMPYVVDALQTLITRVEALEAG
jgi:hypothetical protein